MAYKNQTTVNISWSSFGCFLLFLLFLGLKLRGVITWSWWWVTAPIWIPWGIGLVVALVLLVVYAILKIIESVKDKKVFGKEKK